MKKRLIILLLLILIDGCTDEVTNAGTYIQRSNVGRRQDAVELGVLAISFS